MSQRISKIGIGTIGSLSCECSLNEILISLNDAKITNKTLRRYDYFKQGLKKLKPLAVDRKFYYLMLDLWKQENFQAWKSSNVPRNVYTHLCCCMMAQYRLAKGIK